MNKSISKLEEGHKVTIILGIVVLIVFAIGLYNEAFGEFEFEEFAFTYACPNGECYKVYYQSMERQDMIDYCQLGDKILGCHKTIYFFDKPPVETIALEKGHEFDKTNAGCTIFDHELLHAWGFHEAMILQFFPCGSQPLFNSIPHLGFWK